MLSLLLALAIQSAPDVVVNGSFALGTEGWTSSASPAVIREASGPFLRFQTTASSTPWSQVLTQPVEAVIASGQPLTLRFRARSKQTARIGAMVEMAGEPYTKLIEKTFDLSTSWQNYEISGVSGASYRSGGTNLTFHLAHSTAQIDLGTVQLFTNGGTAAPQIDYRQPVSLIRDGELAQSSSQWGAVSGPAIAFANVASTGPGFGRALQVSAKPKPDGAPWDLQMGQAIVNPVRKGDKLYAQFWIRSAERQPVGVVYELNSAPNTKSLYETVKATPEWKEYRFLFTAAQTFGPSESIFKFFFGLTRGTVEIANVRLQNFGPSAPSSLFNPTLDIYGGAAVNDEWKKAAFERIERIRKGDVIVRVVNSAGKPIPNASVSIDQIRHEFRFGTAGPASRLLGTDPDSLKYQAFVEKNFNTFVFENDLKWRDDSKDLWPVVDEAMVWLNKRKFQVRAHNLVWGSKQFLPTAMKEMPKAQAIPAIEARVRETATRFRGQFYTWDVVNEAATETELWDRVGWDQFANAYKWARESDPTVKLTYNDYNITNDGGGTAQRKKAIERILFLQSNGAPVDYFGDQAHMAKPLPPMPHVLEVWDEVHRATKLPIEITEFDVSVQDDKAHAKYTTDYLIAAFSSPSVRTFVMWGFWEGQHWLAAQGGAMVRQDWSLRPAAVEYEDWVKHRWWTRSRGKSDGKGVAASRAFYGDHEITVTLGGKKVKQMISLKPGGPREFTVRL